MVKLTSIKFNNKAHNQCDHNYEPTYAFLEAGKFTLLLIAKYKANNLAIWSHCTCDLKKSLSNNGIWLPCLSTYRLDLKRKQTVGVSVAAPYSMTAIQAMPPKKLSGNFMCILDSEHQGLYTSKLYSA